MTGLLITLPGVGMLLSTLAGMPAPRLWLAAVLAGSAGGLGAAGLVLFGGGP